MKEVEKFLLLGLLCAHPEPPGRPTMRQVVMILESRFDATDHIAEENGMEAALIKGRMEATNKSRWCFGGRETHSTFEEIRHSLSHRYP